MTEPGEEIMQRHYEEMDAFNPAHAVVTQVGRWKYEIYISHGLMRVQTEWGGPYRYGKQRAKKYAERYLAKYLRQEGQRRSRHRNATKISMPRLEL